VLVRPLRLRFHRFPRVIALLAHHHTAARGPLPSGMRRKRRFFSFPLAREAGWCAVFRSLLS